MTGGDGGTETGRQEGDGDAAGAGEPADSVASDSDPVDALAVEDDPRLTGEQVRRVPGPAGTATLVGVVHDHPASVHRVQAVVESVAPVTLALELPPAAVGLYEAYARGGRSPPAFGGEMSAAIQAAQTDHVVGVDGPSTGFVRELVRQLHREEASLPTVRRAATGVLSAARDAAVCRAAESLAATTSLRVAVGESAPHDTDRADPPAEQAADEQRTRRRSAAALAAFEAPPSVQVQDAAREAHMAARLRALRQQGDVVAVVGAAHLAPVADRILRAPA
jgi:pheromone shutdown protein TraB